LVSAAEVFVGANITTRNLRGEVFYDADCAICSRCAARWGGLFERRGFRWLPLQTPGTSERLGVSESALRAEVKLRLADGRIAGGVDAWAVLLRSIWWLWPVGVFIELPGIRTFGASAYRWFARNRYCISGACGLHNHPPTHHRHAAFFEMP
jgi:predicted DCC family thiol-disulfide oxidoreductase YuxK